jgi:flagellar protein FliS
MSQPSDAYLQTQVLTASPQRLRLMLIEAALRDVDLTARLWDQQQPEQALESLIRCRGIISELIAGIRQGESPLAQKVLGLYLFLFQALTEAQLSRDRTKLAIVRRILSSERDTWQQVCQQLATAPAAPPAAAEITPTAPLALEA